MNQTQYDLTTLDFISPEDRRGEAELYLSKWWDYKMIHPMQATELFVDAYVQARREAYARRVDRDRAEYIKVLEHDHFLESSSNVITGFWRSRQKADELGIPYDFWCASALQYAERRDWRNMPHPWQLAGMKSKFDTDISMVEFIYDKWTEATSTRFHFSKHEYYRAENYGSTSYQIQHQNMILEYIQSRPSALRLIALGDFVFVERLVTEEAAEKTFGRELLNRSHSLIC